MTIEDNFRDEKLQYDIIIEAAKISALSSGKIDKYEYLAGEEITPLDQRSVMEPGKFRCSHLEKALEKETKTFENKVEKQIKSIEDNKKQLYNKQPGNYKLLLSKEIEIFKNIYNKGLID